MYISYSNSSSRPTVSFIALHAALPAPSSVSFVCFIYLLFLFHFPDQFLH
jgi:hypothetical protein